jgi:hypothetical protein
LEKKKDEEEEEATAILFTWSISCSTVHTQYCFTLHYSILFSTFKKIKSTIDIDNEEEVRQDRAEQSSLLLVLVCHPTLTAP